MTETLEAPPLRSSLEASEERFPTPPLEPEKIASPTFDDFTAEPSPDAIAARCSCNGGDPIKARQEVIARTRREAHRLACLSPSWASQLEERRQALADATAAFNETLSAGTDKAGAIVEALLKRAELIKRIEADKATLEYAKTSLNDRSSVVSLGAIEIARYQHQANHLPRVIQSLENELTPMRDIKEMASASGFDLGDVVRQLARECRDASGRVTDQGLASHLSTGRIPSQ